jgi:hypothetical protein
MEHGNGVVPAFIDVHEYHWIKLELIIIFNLTFNILQIINLICSIFFRYKWVEYIGLRLFFYGYYKYLQVELILLIFMDLHLKVGLQYGL